MFSRRTLPVWVGILLMSGMFLTGQEPWAPPACVEHEGDGYGNPASGACAHPEGDCDDNDASVNPGILEEFFWDAACSDGLDNDCDGLIDLADDGCRKSGPVEIMMILDRSGSMYGQPLADPLPGCAPQRGL